MSMAVDPIGSRTIEAIEALTRLVRARTYDPPADLRAAIAELNGAIALADRQKPERAA